MKKFNDFSDYLNYQYIEWMKDARRHKSQNKFAKWLEVSPASLSQWLSGTRQPTGDNVHKIADKLGPKIYDLLDLPRLMPKDERLNFICDVWLDFSDEEKEIIDTFIRGLVQKKQVKGE